MFSYITTFLLKNFSWIAPVGKAIKSFFSPLALITIATITLLVVGNYYFYKGNIVLKQELQTQNKKNQDLNQSIEDLRAEYIKSIDLLKIKETHFKRTLKTLEDLHVKRKKEVKHYAKQKEKNKHLKDAPIAPVLRNTLNSLFQEANSTTHKN